MSTLQFPKDPIVGQEYRYLAYTYKFDGEKWKTIGIGYNPVNDLREEVKEYGSKLTKKVYLDSSLYIQGTFSTGGTLYSKDEVLLDSTTGDGYKWDGVLPKVVPVNSLVPTGTGLGSGKWLPTNWHLNRSYHSDITLKTVQDIVQFKVGGLYYRWDGVFPQGGLVIPQNTPDPSPDQTGHGKYIAVPDLSVKDSIFSALAAYDSAQLVLSTVATAYGVPFEKIKLWHQGESASTDTYYWHNNKIWCANVPGTVLGASPNFSTMHIHPADGVLYPDHFGASYIPGTDQTPAIKRCEDWQSALNAPLRLRTCEHTLLTKLVISRAPVIIAEAGGYGTTSQSPSSSKRRAQGAVLIGEVQNDFSVEVAPQAFEFGGQIENVTITGKATVNDYKTTGHGIRLHNFGWSGLVKGLSVLDFNGRGVEFGYLQDTVFDQLSVIGCGPTSKDRALMFTSNANYIYFNNPHIEDGSYLLGCSESVDKPWEIHWNYGHFESGDYNGAHGPSFDHVYSTPPVEFDGCFRWYWNNLTGVPASVQLLMSVNGKDSASQPYFMQGLNTSHITGSLRFICPRNNGGIDAMILTGLYSSNHFSRIDVEGAQGAKYCVNIESGDIECGSMSFPVASETKMYGFNVNQGFIDKIRFSNNAGGAPKTAGYLVSSGVEAKLNSGEHTYDLGTVPANYINQYVNSSDNRINGYRNLISGESLNMEKIRPDYGIYNGTGNAIIANIINCQRNKRLRIRNDTGAQMTIQATSSVKPNTANPWVVPPYSMASLKSDLNGILYQD